MTEVVSTTTANGKKSGFPSYYYSLFLGACHGINENAHPNFVDRRRTTKAQPIESSIDNPVTDI